MAFEIGWHCQQGTGTADNRDYAGIGIRGDSILAIVLDGSTSGSASGVFARAIASTIVDWFVTGAAEITVESLTEQLRMTHATLSKDFRRDSASYVLLHAGPAQSALVLHAGDCLVGRVDANGRTSWLLQPHTLSNALSPVSINVLAEEDARHVLTRSFRSKRFIAPDLSSIELDHRPLLVATDGFWAELDSDRQKSFLEGHIQASERERDDRSVLSISRNQGGPSTEVAGAHAPESIYVRRG